MTAVTVSPASRNSVGVLKVLTYIDGTLRKDASPVRITRHGGLNGSTAQIDFPLDLYDDDDAALRGAEVVIYAWHDGNAQGRPLFRGWIQEIGGTLQERTDARTVLARSPLGLMDSVWLGQTSSGDTAQGTVVFRRTDFRTGLANNWTIASILQRIFDNSHFWPDGRFSKVKLGDIRALVIGAATTELKEDLLFYAATYESVLDTLLALAGNVGVRERFTSSVTYLDFFRLGPSGIASQTLKVAAIGDSVISGCNVLALDTSVDMQRVSTRVMAVGAPRQMVVTIGTDHDTAWLEPLWPDATDYGSTGPYSAGEIEILSNPNSPKANPDDPQYEEGYELIFRAFGLPSALRNCALDSSLPIEDSLGRTLPPHVAVHRPNLVVGGDGYEQDGMQTNPTVVNVAKWDGERLAFILAEPAVWPTAIDGSASPPIRAMTRCDVYATVSISLTEKPIGYDTGVRGPTQPTGLESDGTTLVIKRGDLKYAQKTSYGLGVTTLAGDAIEYDLRLFQDGEWQSAVTSATVITDDRRSLAALCEATLRAVSKPRVTHAAVMPFIARIEIGDTIAVDQSGARTEPLQVHSISWETITGETRLVATNEKPITISEDDLVNAPMAPDNTLARLPQETRDAIEGNANMLGMGLFNGNAGTTGSRAATARDFGAKGNEYLR